jgi:hypothetical protein
MNFSDFKKSNLILSKEEMKNITGGCGFIGTFVDEAGGTYVARVCNVSKKEALRGAMMGGGYWCCDSCGNTSYCA